MAGNPNIKKQNAADEYTPEKILELKRCINDPVYFIRTYVKIVHPSLGSQPFNLYPYQEKMILAMHNNKHNIFKIFRQGAKTTCSAAYILWFSCFNNDKLCILGSKNLTHAVEIMGKIKFGYECLPSWIKPACVFFNRTSIKFSNGSEIKSVAANETFSRGSSPSLLYIDELAFLPRRVTEALWSSVTPAISNKDSRAIITSTPNGDDDLFATLWRGAEAGLNTFVATHFKYTEHPERGPGSGYYEKMVANLGEVKTRQEVDCEFIGGVGYLVNSIRLTQLKQEEPVWESLGFKFWATPEKIGGKDKTYMLSVDPATGSGNDFSVIEVFEFPTLAQVAEYRSNDLNIPIFYSRIKWILKFLTRKVNNESAEVVWTFERNGIGEAISALYFNDENQIEEADLMSEGNGKYGVFTTPKNKIIFCLQLKNLVEKLNKGIILKSDMLIKELKNFESKGNSYSAKPGMTDDCVMATVGVMRLLKRLSEYNEDAFTVVNEYIDSDKDLDMDSSGEPMPFFVV